MAELLQQHSIKHSKDIALLSSMLSGDSGISYDTYHDGDHVEGIGDEEHLKKAFALFNELSLQLADSYQMLETRVADLTAELDIVSEQRFAELQQKEQLANRLENLINFLPGGVVVLDQQGIVVDSNPTAVAMLDDKLKGQLWRDVILRCFSPRNDDGHEVSNIKGQRISISTRSLAHDGQIILLTDQTGTRQLQAELSRHERLSALGKMVSTLAHQVRTPLSSAMLYANHLLNETLPVAQQQQFSQKLVNRLHEMERQVRDMLLFVKGDVALNDITTVADLHHQLSEVSEALLQTTDVQCHWHVSDKNLLIRCNRDALIGALLNLINNSMEAMQIGDKTARLDISIGRKNARKMHIIIEDCGPGIPEPIQQKINEMFYTTKSQGTGIGLSVVNTVTTSHGGKFNLHSIPSSGVRATIELPIYQPRVDAVLAHSSTASEEYFMSLALADSISSTQQNYAKKILVVEDDYALREALEDTLSLAEYQVVSAKNAELAVDILAQQADIVMIVSDVNMGEMSGHDLLQHVKKNYAHIPMLLITAYASIRDSVAAIRHGAIDYLVKPFEPKALLDIVAHQLGGVVADVKAPVAEDPSSQQLLQLATRVAQSESTVLILGESGTGKEVLARYIHQQSPRAEQPFIAINCAAIPENMLEAMLFGHEKGAYTGAHASAPGKFEQANGGTLLLDEISEMDIGLQAKLLRVLQEREVERLGGRKTIELDVRVIATSNRDMLQQISAGKFREDLYYRLSVLPLSWQPLRERLNDIIPLASQLLNKHAAKQKRLGVQLSPCAQQALLQYGWPGNVRELDNVIQRALILQIGNLIIADDLGLHFTTPILPATQHSVNNTALSNAMTRANNYLPTSSNFISGIDNEDDKPKQLGDDLQQHEFEIIIDTLNQEQGSRKNTAKRLGISPRTLRYKLAKMRDMGLVIEK